MRRQRETGRDGLYEVTMVAAREGRPTPRHTPGAGRVPISRVAVVEVHAPVVVRVGLVAPVGHSAGRGVGQGAVGR